MTNEGHDRAQLSAMSNKAKDALGVDALEVVADRGYFSGEEILACDEADITVTLPKPLTSNNRTKGRFVKQDFRYVGADDVYICPAGERLVYHFTNVEKGMTLRRYWTDACQGCAIKDRCTTGKERRITRWVLLAWLPADGLLVVSRNIVFRSGAPGTSLDLPRLRDRHGMA